MLHFYQQEFSICMFSAERGTKNSQDPARIQGTSGGVERNTDRVTAGGQAMSQSTELVL